MNLSKSEHFPTISKLSHKDKVEFAARCADLGLRLLSSVSFPVPFTDLAVMERVVSLVNEAATKPVDPVELTSALQDLAPLAFVSAGESQFWSATIISLAAGAAHAAGLTALTGLAEHAQDALNSTAEAARTAGADDIQTSLKEELRRIQRIDTDAGRVDVAAEK